MNRYQPPFKISARSISLISDISGRLERYIMVMEQNNPMLLRRVNRIKSIQGTLAIEGNTLTEDQVTAILDGKAIIGPRREIEEVRNAIKAYDSIPSLHAGSMQDLLLAHQYLMQGLIDEVGIFRTSGVGVFSGTQLVHLAPPAERIPALMSDLIQWLDTSVDHPLVKSCVFHYEFEFIHPFADGNGRVGRLWQTLILSEWKPILAHFPLESMIYVHQAAYYEAIQESTRQSDAGIFMEFILGVMLETLETQPFAFSPEVTPEVKRLLAVMKYNETYSRQELQQLLGLKDEKNFRVNYLVPAIKVGSVEMTRAGQPRSRNQRYRKVR